MCDFLITSLKIRKKYIDFFPKNRVSSSTKYKKLYYKADIETIAGSDLLNWENLRDMQLK